MLVVASRSPPWADGFGTRPLRFLIPDEAAAHDADGLAGHVFIRRLRADNEHLAQAAFALGDFADLHRAGEDVAGTDVGEVLVVRAAVEHALEARAEAQGMRA